MNEDGKVVEQPTTDVVVEEKEQPVVEDKATEEKPKAPKISSRRSLSSQVDRLLQAVPEETTEEEVEPEKKPETTEPEVEEGNELEPLEDEAEEAEPVQLEGWQKYVWDNLPDLKVRGHEGEGKDKVYEVKRLEDLPDDFEFANHREELAFMQSLNGQELTARDLLTKYQAMEAQQSQSKFEELEAIDVYNDIRDLQRDGLIPKFKYSEDDPKYNDDPAVKLANEIYDLYTKTNADLYNRYNGTGRMYRISYADAAYRYVATHPQKAEVKTETTPVKSTSQLARERVASKISSEPGGEIDSSKQTKVIRGTSVQDIYRLYKSGRI